MSYYGDDITLWGNDDPVCPYCRETLDDAWDLDLRHDEDETTAECPKCEREYKVQMMVETKYHTKAIEKGSAQ